MRLAMRPICDALELLTAQHEEIDELFERSSHGDAAAFEELTCKLTAHLAVEQELFYPAVASCLAPAVLDEVLAEHVAIKRGLAELVWLGPDDHEFATKLAALGMLLVGHASWQEDELFERAAETLPPAQLAALCDQLLTWNGTALAA